MKEEIFNPEDVKNEFITNTLPEYGRTYSKQQLDLAIYMLTDFVNNLTGNDLYLIRVSEPEPEPQPVYQQPVYQAPPQQMRPQMRVQQVQQPVYQPNPFQEEVGEQQIRDYSDPRTQRMRVDDYAVQREVEEMNAQLRTPQPPRQMQQPQRQMQQPMQQATPVQDVNLTSEKSKTFVDKIKEMRNPRKKEGINPEE
jgi:hypothetical protein